MAKDNTPVLQTQLLGSNVESKAGTREINERFKIYLLLDPALAMKIAAKQAEGIFQNLVPLDLLRCLRECQFYESEATFSELNREFHRVNCPLYLHYTTLLSSINVAKLKNSSLRKLNSSTRIPRRKLAKLKTPLQVAKRYGYRQRTMSPVSSSLYKRISLPSSSIPFLVHLIT